MTAVAVLALSPLTMTWTGAMPPVVTRAAEALGDHQHGAGLVPVEHPLAFARAVDGGGEVEVAGVDEGRDQRAALGRAVAVLDRERDVADVEVQRVTEDQQEERRHERQDQQRAAIAADLPQLLSRTARIVVTRPRLPGAALCPVDDVEKDVLERRLDRRDRADVDAPDPPAATGFIAASASLRPQHGVHGGAEERGLLHLRHRVQRRHRLDRPLRRGPRRSAGRRTPA